MIFSVGWIYYCYYFIYINMFGGHLIYIHLFAHICNLTRTMSSTVKSMQFEIKCVLGEPNRRGKVLVRWKDSVVPTKYLKDYTEAFADSIRSITSEGKDKMRIQWFDSSVRQSNITTLEDSRGLEIKDNTFADEEEQGPSRNESNKRKRAKTPSGTTVVSSNPKRTKLFGGVSGNESETEQPLLLQPLVLPRRSAHGRQPNYEKICARLKEGVGMPPPDERKRLVEELSSKVRALRGHMNYFLTRAKHHAKRRDGLLAEAQSAGAQSLSLKGVADTCKNEIDRFETFRQVLGSE